MNVVEGTKIRLSVVFMTAAGVVDDPITFALKMLLTPFTYVYTYGEANYDILEDGELPTTAAGPPDIVRDSAGNYRLDIVMDTPGDWIAPADPLPPIGAGLPPPPPMRFERSARAVPKWLTDPRTFGQSHRG